MTTRPPPLPLGLGRLLEPAYRAVVAQRNRSFDRGSRVARARVPVISVGNLSVGGTGKTPMVRCVVRWLLDAHHAPFIAMRGYKARRGEASDEQAEYMASLPGVTVLAAPDRASAIARYLDSVDRAAATCCVLDDGFQHRFAARELDILLVDATRPPFDDRCLPAGWLREPVESLARAGAIVITRADLVSERARTTLESRIRASAPGALVASCRHRWAALLDADGAAHPVERLRGLRVAAACSIGNPDAFFRQLEDAGAEIAFRLARRDHAPWTRRAVSALLARSAGAAAIVTTDKDWSTLNAAIDEARTPILRPRVEIDFLTGGPELRELVARAARDGTVQSPSTKARDAAAAR